MTQSQVSSGIVVSKFEFISHFLLEWIGWVDVAPVEDGGFSNVYDYVSVELKEKPDVSE